MVKLIYNSLILIYLNEYIYINIYFFFFFFFGKFIEKKKSVHQNYQE